MELVKLIWHYGTSMLTDTFIGIYSPLLLLIACFTAFYMLIYIINSVK